MEWVLYLIAFFINAALAFAALFGNVSISDLEKDYINPQDTAERLNKLRKPEGIATLAFTILKLAVGRWGVALCVGPLLYLYGTRYNSGYTVDATQLFNGRGYLTTLKRERQAKLAFWSCMLFKTVWSMTHAIVAVLFGVPSDA